MRRALLATLLFASACAAHGMKARLARADEQGGDAEAALSRAEELVTRGDFDAAEKEVASARDAMKAPDFELYPEATSLRARADQDARLIAQKRHDAKIAAQEQAVGGKIAAVRSGMKEIETGDDWDEAARKVKEAIGDAQGALDDGRALEGDPKYAAWAKARRLELDQAAAGAHKLEARRALGALQQAVKRAAEAASATKKGAGPRPARGAAQSAEQPIDAKLKAAREAVDFAATAAQQADAYGDDPRVAEGVREAKKRLEALSAAVARAQHLRDFSTGAGQAYADGEKSARAAARAGKSARRAAWSEAARAYRRCVDEASLHISADVTLRKALIATPLGARQGGALLATCQVKARQAELAARRR